MIYLIETAVGYALFNKDDESEEIKVIDTYAFKNTDNALNSTMLIINGEVPDDLLNFINRNEFKKSDVLAVGDQKLLKNLEKTLKRKIICEQESSLRSDVYKHFGITEHEYAQQLLWLSHKISSSKVKLSPEKLDTMIIQSISLASDLEKDTNLHTMRLKEWYGFHFPELASVIDNNKKYLETIVIMKNKKDISKEKLEQLKAVLGEDYKKVVSLANSSMGADMAEKDIESIVDDAKTIIKSYEYREKLLEYIKTKMEMVAPNITALIGDQMGARFIEKAGSLDNLAKMPASTIQIMGSEKALFQALKNKTNTPKHGLIYNCSIIGKISAELRGKLSRSLASKISVVAKVDALTSTSDNKVGMEAKKQIENRILHLEMQTKSTKKRNSQIKHKISAEAKYDNVNDVKKVKKNN